MKKIKLSRANNSLRFCLPRSLHKEFDIGEYVMLKIEDCSYPIKICKEYKLIIPHNIVVWLGLQPSYANLELVGNVLKLEVLD